MKRQFVLVGCISGVMATDAWVLPSRTVPLVVSGRRIAGYASFSSGRATKTVVGMSSSDDWNSNADDSNQWQSSVPSSSSAKNVDWREQLESRQDGSFWSTFAPLEEEKDNDDEKSLTLDAKPPSEEDVSEAWLNTLAELANEEISFNLQEAERADKARQMEEWGFDSGTIANALGVATDTKLEDQDQVAGMQAYREASYLEDVDLETVDSHTMIERDENGEPIRTQMVYVDEHTCIGCTNCAMIAQSTFFMYSEHGRARVFSQWGDDEETIAVAIETCPVDCIHYVHVDELERLEIERRGQNINFKARLVSQAEGNSAPSHLVGGAAKFTAPQRISGNAGSRCNNCPSRGCADCPMYGVGKNPNFERKEQERKARLAKSRLQKQREQDQKTADL